MDSNSLPKGWAAVRVDRVGAVRLGRQRSPDKHTGEHTTKYLRAANIKPNGLDLTDILTMDFTPAERLVFSLRVGDILLTEASGSSSQVGRAALWCDELPDCCYQNTIIRFRPHAALSDYALIVFRHYAVSGIFGRIARGVGIQHLGASRFAELQFPLPPLNEQKRIAEAVAQRTAEIRKAGSHLQSASKRLYMQRQEILAAAVSGELVAPSDGDMGSPEHASAATPHHYKNGDNPQGALFESHATPHALNGDLVALPAAWVWTRIDSVGEVRIGRQRSPKHHHGDHVRPYLRVANVFEDRIDTSEVHQMNFTPEEYAVYALKRGDILLNEGQSPELVGRPAMFRGELDSVCFQNTLIRFRAGPLVDPEFALLVFMHYLHSGRFRKIARWSTNIAHLGLDRFRAMPFPLPPLAEQQSIAREAKERLRTADAQAAAVRTSIERLPEMERELLGAAVAGELVPHQPDDEPATQLLDRLGPPPETAASARAPKRDTKTKGRPSMKTSKQKTMQLSALLLKAGRPLPLPELFALAGFDRDQPEEIEMFYLALRSELDRTIRRIGRDTENATLEAITDAP
jgi:restriction endonuclease S subunit